MYTLHCTVLLCCCCCCCCCCVVWRLPIVSSQLMQFFRRLQPRKRVKPSIAILFYHRDVRLCRLLLADINVIFVLWHWNLPDAFASASRRLKVDLILLGQLIIQRDPGRSRIAKKDPCRPTTSGKSLKKRLGPRPTLRHWYLHHLVESGTLEKPPFWDSNIFPCYPPFKEYPPEVQQFAPENLWLEDYTCLLGR